MRKKLLFALFFFVLSGLSFAGIYFYQKLQAPAALQVTAIPKSQVYLDGQFLGTTPLFNDKIKQGEHIVKIIPEGQGSAFEQKIKFSPLLLTAIDRIFRETESESEGTILTLEEIQDKTTAQLAVSSTPQNAQVFFDGEPKGVTPLALNDVSISDHEITLKLSGYQEKKVRVKTSAGYRLMANIKLALGEQEAQEASPSPSPAQIATPSASIIQIKQTPTGFLRVRFEPSLVASEVARVNPGETFEVLEKTSSWTKIKLPEDKSGWVSNQYITAP